MYWPVAYFEATDRAATDNDEAAIGSVGDYIINAHHTFPKNVNILAVMSMGISSSRVRFDSPQIRRITGAQMDIWPFERAAIPSEFSNIAWFDRFPIPLRVTEELVCKHSGNGTTGTNENWTTIVFVGDRAQPSPGGVSTTIQFTSATTLVANAWSNCAITLSETLPAGRYRIDGMQCYSANGQAFRVRGQQGVIGGGGICGNANLGLVPSFDFWNGRLGSYLEFDSTLLPSVEILANVADTAQTGWLRLVAI